ncbi:kinase-like protein [Apiospora sp. TS-2023a]
MSSAALQAAPHQPTSLPASSPEGYYARENLPSASPASSTRPSRRPSATSTVTGYPDQTQSSPMTSRTAMASPVPVAAVEYQHSPPSNRRRHEPPTAPPRTSSTQHSSRRAARAEERASSSSRAPNGEPSSSRHSQNGYDDSRTRRAQQQERGRQDSATISTAMPIRTNPTPSTRSSSKQPSREASEVLNQIVVSQPEVDLAREQERQDEAHALAAASAAAHEDYDDSVPPPIVASRDAAEEPSRRGGRSRHDHSKREKATKFGEYYLGSTIGEGEFGKVKLGWKQDGGVQVAIKLIRRDSVGSNPSRLNKIYREVSILRGVSHPNIVRLHEMSETERHIGIVLEYASGGELFDYILNHRYLKDNAARRLFAQLVSGVGYLHKKGIVHRDLKLENLLLDRNRNIIITDFGFANTFDANDELTEQEELGLGDRDYVKSTGLDKTKPNGLRRGDLMQTSCGSPCYAAPELVVSDSLYTGRKVDVWSCGVILYAMLAGYLPFDDDPANPEGDNINLLYKYIVNTPLTFPEYVTPHARDLLRRILVPSPRKRADLFEVARHSWLAEYAHVVELITSTTTTTSEIQNTTVPDEEDDSGLARSASVREPTKAKPQATAVGDLARKQGPVDPEEAQAYTKTHKDNKRRTVQVEYVAPTTQTQRGGESASPRGKGTKARSSSQGPVPVEVHTSPQDKPLPRDPPVAKEAYSGSPSQNRSTRPPSAHRNQNAPVARPHRESTRSASETAYMTTGTPGHSVPRPATRGSMHSTGSGSRHGLGSSRASYGQPIPPTVAGTNAQGRMSQPQPKGGAKNYPVSNSASQETPDMEFGKPSVTVPDKFARVSGYENEAGPQRQHTPQSATFAPEVKGHRRSNTIGGIGDKLFGRSGSLFGGRKKRPEQQQPVDKPNNRKYPPVSMGNMGPVESGRPSIDSRASRRSFSQALGLSKKRSGSIAGSQVSLEKPLNPRRFSLMKAMGLARDAHTPSPDPSQQNQDYHGDEYGRQTDARLSPSHHQYAADGSYDETHQRDASTQHPESPSYHQRHASSSRPNAVPSHMQQGAVLNSGSESSVDRPQRRTPNSAPYQGGYDSESTDQRRSASRGGRGVLQKNKRFVDSYDGEEYGKPHDHAGSSGAAKRVMDFFRRRGKARGGEV